MPNRVRSAVIACLLLAPAALAQTAPIGETVLDKIITSGVLHVGSTGDYKPFSYLNPETKAFEGIDIDMAASLAKALGVKLEVVKTTWSTLLPDLIAGKYEMAMG